MKATGIIRRMDDLGRVVIPKELRKKFNIYEGDALEIYTTNEGIVFAPYNNHVEKEAFATEWLRKQREAMKSNCTQFTMEDNVTLCEIITFGRKRVTGEAVCNPKDEFCPAIGMVISYCRALGLPIPTELQ